MHISDITTDLEDEANVFAKPYAKQLYVCFLIKNRKFFFIIILHFKGWIVDFINHFGRLGGFKNLLERFTNGPKLTIQIIAALLK